ncbi:hypothetical protein [Dactylosporangium sp. NPDC048998]|uniref:hypothetical protein n=1 Tax=Dactylosporangium sp. NPDC048998 TaxID=3363976 RepID=UPI00371268C0
MARPAVCSGQQAGYCRVPVWQGRVRAVPGGDRTEEAIMAAAILAKVARDAEMVRLDALHPGYGFAQNKGYGAPAIAALDALGVCRPHRRTRLSDLSWADGLLARPELLAATLICRKLSATDRRRHRVKRHPVVPMTGRLRGVPRVSAPDRAASRCLVPVRHAANRAQRVSRQGLSGIPVAP